MSFDVNGDAGTAVATDDALQQIMDGGTQACIDLIANAPPGPIETEWGVGYRSYSECWAAIHAAGVPLKDGELRIPMRYTIKEESSYSIVQSNALWNDPSRAAEQKLFRKDEQDNGRTALYFPQTLRDARKLEDYRPGIKPNSAEAMDKLGVSVAHLDSQLQGDDFYDHEKVESVYYPELEKMLLEMFPDATDALVYNHDVFNKEFDQSDPRALDEQDIGKPGVNGGYANLVHNDLNDNSGRVRCRELLIKNLRNFGREQNYTPEEADAKMSKRFVSINLAKPIETVHQNPFVLCAWPSFADQPYINNYRVYDDRVGETTRFTHRADHEWYWLPKQEPTEVSMLKCYDSVTDGSVSRWSFHSAAIDPSLPSDAPCRKNLVVRSYIFY